MGAHRVNCAVLQTAAPAALTFSGGCAQGAGGRGRVVYTADCSVWDSPCVEGALMGASQALGLDALFTLVQAFILCAGSQQ